MNVLSFVAIADPIDNLVFELRIDGKPLPEVINCSERTLPWWLIDGDLPVVDGQLCAHAICNRILAVCSCGEFECGGTWACVVKEDDIVTLTDFQSTRIGPIEEAVDFVFSKVNYDAVLAHMTVQARFFTKPS